MNELIDHILATEFEYTPDDGDSYPLPYSFKTNKSISATLTELFENNNLGINDWDIDGETLFDNPSYTTGYVVASWIENGLLQTYHIIWEIK